MTRFSFLSLAALGLLSAGTGRTTVKKMTPVLTVPAVEPSLPFWQALGFEQTMHLDGEEGLVFAALAQGGHELMLQTRASVAGDQPAVAAALGSGYLYLEVEDLEQSLAAVHDHCKVLDQRVAFYGMKEALLEEPGGHFVTLAMPTAEPPPGGIVHKSLFNSGFREQDQLPRVAVDLESI